MKIGFTGSQSGMTSFQEFELIKLLKLKECSEFVFYDLLGSNTIGAHLASDNGVKLFTVYPPADLRKQANTFDVKKEKQYNKIETPYLDQFGIKIKWMPVETYFDAHKKIVEGCALFIAAPKEFKFTVRSAVWSVIKNTWKLKKDIIIIPPIERDNTNVH